MPRKRKGNGRRRPGRSRKVKAPVSSSQVIRPGQPLQQIRIQHREFLTDIAGVEEFTIGNLFINPGLASSCPWLSTIAAGFETYVFNRLKFCYVPSCATTETGAIIIAPDYDPSDDNGQHTKGEILSFADSVRTPWWAAAEAQLSPKSMHTRRRHFIRNGAVNVTDVKAYDCARLWVGIQAGSTSVLGELWIDYDVTLFTPQREKSIDVPMAFHSIDPNEAITNVRPLGEYSPTRHEYNLHGLAHEAMNHTNYVLTDRTGDGDYDSIAFTFPGKYYFSYSLSGVSDMTSQPKFDYAISNDRAGTATVTDIISTYNSANVKYVSNHLIDIPHESFDVQHYLSITVGDLPYIALNVGVFAATAVAAALFPYYMAVNDQALLLDNSVV